MARPRSLPPGIRPRGNAFVYGIAYKAKIDAELATGTFVAGSKTPFAEYAAHWIETYQLKSQSRRGYGSTLHAHLVPFFGRYRLVKITPALVREWYAQQLTLGLANNTVREHVAVLKSILKTAQSDGHLPYLPTTGLRVPRQQKRRPKVLTFKQAWALVMAAPEEWRALFATAIFTGLRLGELLALSRDDLDLEHRVLHVTATLSEVARRKPRLVREEPKSEAGIRDVPIVEPLAELLTAHLDRLPADRWLIFTTETGAMLDRSAVYRVWHPVRDTVGLPELRFHDLRHTAASLLLTSPTRSFPSSRRSSATARSPTPSTSTATSCRVASMPSVTVSAPPFETRWSRSRWASPDSAHPWSIVCSRARMRDTRAGEGHGMAPPAAPP
jgi:integrase